jgi:hypothetical protein
MTRGGKRQGAGRPIETNPAKSRNIRLTDSDYYDFQVLGGVKWLREQLKKEKNGQEFNYKLYEKAEYIVNHENWDGKIKTAEELIANYSPAEIQDMYDMIDDCEQYE